MSSPYNAANIPIEAVELNQPVIYERHELIPDSGGAGRFRGGLGVRKDVRVLADDVVLSNLTDRHVFAPYGLRGGASGVLGEIVLNPGTARERRLHPKETVPLP